MMFCAPTGDVESAAETAEAAALRRRNCRLSIDDLLAQRRCRLGKMRNDRHADDARAVLQHCDGICNLTVVSGLEHDRKLSWLRCLMHFSAGQITRTGA
jgi:hypothetical protein